MTPERFLPLVEQGELPAPLAHLITDGYAIVRRASDPERIGRMSAQLDERFARTPFSVGPFHGPRTKRFHRLLARSDLAAELAIQPKLYPTVQRILGLWCDFPELNLTQGVEIHPGAPGQIPHCDQGMWPAAKGTMEFCVNVFWPMTRFTERNGATRVWPRTHLRPRNPEDPLDSPLVCEMEPGDALMILGSTVHAAGANRSDHPRRAAIFSYCLGWLKAYENQSLAYSQEFARTLDPEIAALIGYRWHRPNLGTYDGQCPSVLLQDDVPDHLATIDALSPAHQALIERFAAHDEQTAASP